MEHISQTKRTIRADDFFHLPQDRTISDNITLKRSSNYSLVDYQTLKQILNIKKDPFSDEIKMKATNIFEKVRSTEDTMGFEDAKYTGFIEDSIDPTPELYQTMLSGWFLIPLSTENEFKPLKEKDLYSRYAQLIQHNTIDSPNSNDIKVHHALLEWTKRYGLPFSFPISWSTSLPDSIREILQSSDYIYTQCLQRNFQVPYFMSLDALLALNKYAFLLFRIAHIWGIENRLIIENPGKLDTWNNRFKIYLDFLQDTETSLFSELDKLIWDKEGFFRAPISYSQKERSWLRDTCLEVLGKEISAWITFQLHLIRSVKNDKEGFIPSYHIPHLFSAIMFQQYNALISKHSRYLGCKYCGRFFDSATSRKDKRYCDGLCRRKNHFQNRTRNTHQ